MRIAKKALCLFLTVLLLVGAVPAAFALPQTEIKGKCGSFAGYTLYTETGELQIYMIGGAKSAYMDDYENNESPFYGNTQIKTVVVTPWIWNVGSRAFAGCSNLEQITLSFTVNQIGAHALDGCDNAQIVFEGTENAWKDVEIGEGNDWKNDPSRIKFTMQALDRVSATFPLPHAGDQVKLNQELAVGDSEKYEAELISVSFEENSVNTYLKDGDELKAGTAYTFEIAFIPKEHYAIEDETTFEINGEIQSASFGTVSLKLVPAAAEPDSNENLCAYCSKDHSKQPLGFLVQWFHNLLLFFKRLTAKK